MLHQKENKKDSSKTIYKDQDISLKKSEESQEEGKKNPKMRQSSFLCEIKKKKNTAGKSNNSYTMTSVSCEIKKKNRQKT